MDFKKLVIGAFIATLLVIIQGKGYYFRRYSGGSYKNLRQWS